MKDAREFSEVTIPAFKVSPTEPGLGWGECRDGTREWVPAYMVHAECLNCLTLILALVFNFFGENKESEP